MVSESSGGATVLRRSAAAPDKANTLERITASARFIIMKVREPMPESKSLSGHRALRRNPASVGRGRKVDGVVDGRRGSGVGDDDVPRVAAGRTIGAGRGQRGGGAVAER